MSLDARFDALWRAVEPAVIGTIRSVGRGLDHDELLQETRVRVFVKHRSENEAQFRAFACRVATNLAIQEHRSAWRSRVMSIDSRAVPTEDGGAVPLSEIVPDRAAGALAAILRRERLAEALAALDRLPEGRRVVARMYLIEGMSVAEIATALGVPVTTVKSRLHRALTELGRRSTAGGPTRRFFIRGEVRRAA